MGSLFSRLMKAIRGIRESRILFLGLDAAGLRSYLSDPLKAKRRFFTGVFACQSTFTLKGFNVETLNVGNIEFTAWDVGGEDKIRPLWRHYLENTSGVVFVIDSNDRERLEEARDTINIFVESPEYENQPILIYLNKQDIDGCMSTTEFIDLFRPEEFFHEGSEFHIQPSIAIKGEGLVEGIEWLATKV